MQIALIQQVATPDKQANVERGLRALDEAAAAGAKLACFAELAFECFYPQRQAEADYLDLAEPIPGPITEAFQARARRLGVVVVLNLFERDGDRTFDSSPVIDADGRLLGRTRMIHITEYQCFHEQGYYMPGDTGAPVYQTPRRGVWAWRSATTATIPRYMRALAIGGAELVVVPQAGAVGEWPEGLYEAEMRVSAFQNGYFTALCNRVGQEECLNFGGESFVCAPDGRVIARAGSEENTILYADLDMDTLDKSHARTAVSEGPAAESVRRLDIGIRDQGSGIGDQGSGIGIGDRDRGRDRGRGRGRVKATSFPIPIPIPDS